MLTNITRQPVPPSYLRESAAILVAMLISQAVVFGQAPRNEDLVVPDGFHVEKLRIQLDSPGRFATEYASGLLVPLLTEETGPVFVRGRLRITGKWDQRTQGLADNDEDRSGEIILKFRAVPLLSVEEAFAAIKQNNDARVSIEHDAASGVQRMVWHLNRTSGKEDAPTADSPTDDWRNGKSAQDCVQKLEFELKRSKQEVVVDVPIEFIWYPQHRWPVNVFFAIDVAHSIPVELETTGLFHAAAKAPDPARKVRLVLYRILTDLGFPLNPFWWLK